MRYGPGGPVAKIFSQQAAASSAAPASQTKRQNNRLGQYGFRGQAFARLGFGRVGIFVRIDVVRRQRSRRRSKRETVTRTAEQKKQKQAKRKPAKPQQAEQAPAPVMNARAQIGAAPVQSLDTITAVATRTEERAIDALAPVSVVTLEQIQGRQASTLGGLLYNIPGVWVQDRGDEPSTSINIRGLQDFGRVAVVVDGARQNYQRTGHFANGSFFLNPELVGGIDIVRGPTANIYGSGAIGGVASFRTKDIEDVVRRRRALGCRRKDRYSEPIRGARLARSSAVFTSTRTSTCSPAAPTARRKATRTAPASKSPIPETGSPPVSPS